MNNINNMKGSRKNIKSLKEIAKELEKRGYERKSNTVWVRINCKKGEIK